MRCEEIKLSSHHYICSLNQVLGKVPRADMLAAQNQVQCDMTRYSTRVFWLFSFCPLYILSCVRPVRRPPRYRHGTFDHR
jgi:hypothetical protein